MSTVINTVIGFFLFLLLALAYSWLKKIVRKKRSSKVRRNTFSILDEHAKSLPFLSDSSHWRLTGADLTLLFPALPSLVPNGSILCLTGGAWPDRVQKILDRISLNMELAPPANLTLDFAEAYYVSITAQKMATLAELSEHRSEIQIAIALAVISDNERLLEWFDLPDDPIFVSEAIQAESVSHFAKSVGAKCQRIIFCDNRSFIDV